MPIQVPMSVARIVAVPTSSTVGQMRSAMTEKTGCRNCSDSTSGLNGLRRYETELHPERVVEMQAAPERGELLGSTCRPRV